MTRDDRTLIEDEGVNAASGDDEQSSSPGDVLGPVAGTPDESEEQPATGQAVGAPEQIPGKPGQQLELGEG